MLSAIDKRLSMQIYLCLLLLGLCSSSSIGVTAEFSAMSQTEQTRIAERIFQNECAGKTNCLVSWNDGENFASLGIGHFIWFPKDSKAPFQESFPDLLRWFQAHDVLIPAQMSSWLIPENPCPWQTKQDFLKAENQSDIDALRTFLLTTKAEQASFIIDRLSKALPKVLTVGSSEEEKEHMKQQFYRVAASPSGWYALTDYVNFKGEGTKLSERYQGKGWGLAQVLRGMKGKAVGKEAMVSFVNSASYALEQRVKISPPARNEQRWLAGWKKRLTTYLK